MSQNNLFGIACKTCRRRGRKCDRSLPKCNNCSLRGTECEGYALRWVDAAPSKGKSSKEHTDTKSRAIIRQQKLSILMNLGTTSDDLGGFVNYYAREISEAFYLGHGPVETPYTRHVLPMIRSVPSVRCAVAATAACHIANRLEDDQMKRQSLHLRLKATELLREELKGYPEGPDLTCLVCMLLLAQLDVCSGDCVEFETHLKAASTFIKQRGSDGTERGFIEQRIAWLDVMGATTSSRMPHWSPEDLAATLNKFWTPSGKREWGFDVFYCPIDLFEYIADITVLYKLEPDAIQKAILLGNAIKRWVCICDSDPRRHMVEVWRLGTLLYLIRLFRLPSGIFNTANTTTCIFHHARAIPSKTSWSYSISWPLFQAGLLLPPENSQIKAWLRNELYKNFCALGCFHQKLAIEALEQTWRSGKDRQYDLSSVDFPQRKLIL